VALPLSRHIRVAPLPGGQLPYWRLSSFYLFYFALLGATAPFLALYFHHLGFSSARIGELVAIPMLMRCVAPNIWGWLGDYTGRRLAIVRFGAVCTLLTFSLILVDKSYAWLAMVMALHAFFWHAVLPQFEVITLAHLQGQTSRYSQIRLWGSVGFILAVVGLGRLFEGFSLDLYPQALLFIIVGIVVSSAWVPNAHPVLAANRSNEGGFLRQLTRPGVLAFYASVALMQLSHGPYYTFLTLHLEQLGYSRGFIGMLWAVGVVAEVLMFMAMSRLLQRFSVRQVLLASFLLAALRWLLLGSFAEYLPVLIFAQVLHAATFGSFHAAAIHFVQRSFGPRQQGQGQALYAALAGTGGALGALYSGYSWNVLGAGWTFTIASVAALAAAVVTGSRMKDAPVTRAG
jgi:PPP family 3-phenylpropionic acid transporter